MRAGEADRSPTRRGWLDDGPPAAAAGLLWVDGAAAITDADAAACELLGYPREELVGLRLGDVDVEFLAERWPGHLAELRRRGARVLQSRLRTRAGALVPVEVTAFAGPPGGDPRVGLLLHDLGERRRQQAEELAARRRLDAMLDAIPDPLFEVDLDGRYHAAHAGDDPLLARPAAELLGRTLAEVLPPEAAATCHAALDEAHREGRSRGHRFELDVALGRRCFEISVARRSTLAGEEPRFMSHELRMPLNGVLGNIQLLQMTQVDERQRQYLADIALSGKSLLSLINDILDLSKIEAQKVVPGHERFGLRTAIDNSCWVHRGRAAEKGLTLEVRLQGGLPDLVVGDELRVKQILSNLIGNALKFTARGGVTVAARLLARAGDAATVELTVTDTGIGVPRELREAIFEPFAQADSSITRRYGGTGLGLTISRRLAELMGGRISLESDEGVGSAFRVVLPLAIEPGGATAQTDSEPSGAPLWSGPPLHVLLAEDDPVSRAFEVAVLARMGHRVTAVVDGHEALAALGREAFDLVLLDIQMPLLDGRQVLAALRAGERSIGAHLPAVAVTAFASRDEESGLLAAEFDAYVRKPVEVTELVRAMRRALAVGKLHP